MDSSGNVVYPLTSWAWNVRVGDRMQFNGSGQVYTVVGPVFAPNPERFINFVNSDGSSANTLPADSSSGISLQPEFLFLANGVDDNGDGFIDNTFDGFNDGSTEAETWVGTQLSQYQQEYLTRITLPMTNPMMYPNPTWNSLSYKIFRRPIASPGARETLLPSNVVIDMTTLITSSTTVTPNRERSRLPIDGPVPWITGDVDGRSLDILISPNGQIVPTTLYSSPSKFSDSPFVHLWLTDREGVVTPAPDTSPLITTSLGSIYLPMPQSTPSYPTTGPFLQGERMLVTIFARTGNLTINSLQDFDAVTPDASRPFYNAQRGVKESP